MSASGTPASCAAKRRAPDSVAATSAAAPSASTVTAAACATNKKARTADVPAQTQANMNKSLAQQAAMGAALAAAGWTYPSMPMGPMPPMLPPMAMCPFPGNPFFNPFMFPPPFFPFAPPMGMPMPGGMPPGASPALIMQQQQFTAAAATAAAAAAAGAGPIAMTVPGASGAAAACLVPAGTMPQFAGCSFPTAFAGMAGAGPQPGAATSGAWGPAMSDMVRASSGVSGVPAGAFSAASSSHSGPAAPLASSPPLSACSPLSVGCGASAGGAAEEHPAPHEDDEFASFIDSFIKGGSGEAALGAGDSGNLLLGTAVEQGAGDSVAGGSSTAKPCGDSSSECDADALHGLLTGDLDLPVAPFC